MRYARTWSPIDPRGLLAKLSRGACVVFLWLGITGETAVPLLVSRSFDRLVVSTNGSIVVTAVSTNSGAAPLRGFYFTDYLPTGLVVRPLGVLLNGQAISNYFFEAGQSDDVYPGCIPYRWVMEKPSLFSESNAVPPGAIVRISYTLSGMHPGSRVLEHFSWAGAGAEVFAGGPGTNLLPASGLVGRIGANEGSGLVLGDSVDGVRRLGSSLTLANPTWGTNFVAFQGNGSFAQFDNTNTAITNRVTVAGWFKFEPYATGDDSCVLLYSPDLYTRNSFIWHTVPGSGIFRFRYHTTLTGSWTGGDLSWQEVPPGEWHHLALVLDLTQGANCFSFYVDGIKKTLFPYGGSVPANSGLDSGILQLATYAPPNGNNAHYSLGEFVIYNRVLSAAEIVTVMDATSHYPVNRPLELSEMTFGYSQTLDAATVTFTGNTNPTLLTGTLLSGGIRIGVTGDQGPWHALDVSTNLIHWSPLITNRAPFEYSDGVTGFYQRFYRARQLP